MASTSENLLRLMNIPSTMGLDGIVKTADGYYVGRVRGDCGYNAFIGKPAPVHPGPGLNRTLETWAGLDDGERAAVRTLAASPVDGAPINLADFGIPLDNCPDCDDPMTIDGDGAFCERCQPCNAQPCPDA